MEDIVPVQLKENNTIAKKLFPLLLGLFILIADQVTKVLVFENIEVGTVFMQFFGDFFRITHVWNTGGAFSFGHDWPELVQNIVLKGIPLIALILIMIFYFKTDDFTTFQRWGICGVVGGGLGNLIDRFFRSGGVVDFIDIKFYGLFGAERFPTFNIADMSIVICSILLMISFIRVAWKEHKEAKTAKLEETEK